MCLPFIVVTAQGDLLLATVTAEIGPLRGAKKMAGVVPKLQSIPHGRHQKQQQCHPPTRKCEDRRKQAIKNKMKNIFSYIPSE